MFLYHSSILLENSCYFCINPTRFVCMEVQELQDRICLIINNYYRYRKEYARRGMFEKVKTEGKYEGFSYQMVSCPDQLLKNAIDLSLQHAQGLLFIGITEEELLIAEKAEYNDYLGLAATIMNVELIHAFSVFLRETSVITFRMPLVYAKLYEFSEMITNVVFRNEANKYVDSLSHTDAFTRR